ncbi:MAG: thiamine diphosphokinase [Rhodobacteraceae bacterium]|nr:thiamine diphosphokinase [Paracoccaceae bacterium]
MPVQKNNADAQGAKAQPLVRSAAPLTLVGAGELVEADIEACLAQAPMLVAVDGGALACLRYGYRPAAVIGDLDSLTWAEAVSAGIEPQCIHHIAEQNSTDFAKALRHVAAPLVIGAGFFGKRLDHQLACCHAMVRHADRCCLLVGGADLAFVLPPSLHLPLAAGTRVSLFPLGRVHGHSSGLRWPIDGRVFRPESFIGTSNQAIGAVSLTISAPRMLAILPRALLPIVARILAALPRTQRWPPLLG